MRAKQIHLSVVIPSYNSWTTVCNLLESLQLSSYKQFSVIIGDDASHEEKPKKLLTLLRKKIGQRLVEIVRLPINKGPASARNSAAKRAKGDVLVFLDSDVRVYADTLAKIAEKFSLDHDLTAVTGVWDKEQHTSSFFPQFKALRDWSYWINERDRDGYYYLFSTRIAAIKRDVFVRLGGFTESFREMEDVEITYRIAKRYAIIFAPDVRVHHEFEGFFPIAKKYFWRSYYWSRLWRARHKFDPVATTVWESISGMTGAGSVALFTCGIIVGGIGALSHAPWQVVLQISSLCYQASFIVLCVHAFLLRKFLSFVYREKGLVFALKSLGIGIVLYCVIVAGALYYAIRK